jgi:hypothetical protein
MKYVENVTDLKLYFQDECFYRYPSSELPYLGVLFNDQIVFKGTNEEFYKVQSEMISGSVDNLFEFAKPSRFRLFMYAIFGK